MKSFPDYGPVFSSRGFTLIETIFVAAIGIILASVMFASLTNQSAIQNLDFAASSLVSYLRDAQERARGQQSGLEWGVQLNNSSGSQGYYVLFSGPTLTSTTSVAYLPLAVEFSNPASGFSKEILFSKQTGLPVASNTIILRLVNDPSRTKTITVNLNGSIAY
jgi:type II secretory pathway pseudopilin PulG